MIIKLFKYKNCFFKINNLLKKLRIIIGLLSEYRLNETI